MPRHKQSTNSAIAPLVAFLAVNLQKLYVAASKAIAPTLDMLPSQWVETRMFLPQGTSARPGWVTLDPFQREPLDCWAASHPCRRMVLKCGSQIMKTFIAQGATGYSVEVEPGPILIGQPREKDVKAFVTDKLDPMLENTPSLRSLIAKKKSRDSMNNTEFKKFVGGSITIAGAHAPANFCMRGVRYAIFDEPDRYPRSAGKEGSPVALGRQRLTDYSDNCKELMCGTPTMSGESIIEEEYEGSDQREWFVPCPECGHEQVLRFDQLRWGTYFDVEIDILDAHYQCESCNALIPHHKKAWMNDHGRWIPQNPAGTYPGFHASQMISPRKSWGLIAEGSVKAKGDREKEITFANTVLAEAYKDKGETVDHEKVLGRVEDYNLGIVPNGPVFLTAGIDVQKDRIEMQVQGWARGKARWVVDYVVLQGDPKRPEVWESLTEAINVTYESEAGVSLPIARCMIDSGYATTEVYAWARLQGSSRVLVGKGYDRGIGILGSPTSAEVDWRGKKRRFGVKVWPVNVSLCKSELYGQLGLAKPEAGKPFPPGYVHIPRLGWVPDMPLDEFCRQLTAEQYVIKTVKGNKRGEWVKRRPRNEGLDTSNLARAAAEHFGISRFTDSKWKSLEAQFMGAISGMQPDPDPPDFELIAPNPGEQPVSTPTVPIQSAPQPRALPAIPPRPTYRPIVSEDPYLS